MNVSINLGAWNSVFVVPSIVIEKYIKLAGAAQLKVLLIILRYAGQPLSIEKIAETLSMNNLDVKDSIQFWVETKLISLEDNYIVPHSEKIIESNNNSDNKNKNIVSIENQIKNVKPIRQLSKPTKPDMDFVAQRIKDSSEIASLMQEAQIILSRPLSNGECATLLMLHDTDGLPIDVILMLMQYAVSIGKGNIKYIEKTAISWSDEEIDTIEKAEKRIRMLEDYKKAWTRLERIIGIEHRSPSSREDEAANRWINVWKMPDDLIKEAYDRCINQRGRYILNYMDSIIKRWYKEGIKTLSQALQENKYNKNKHLKKLENEITSYNIDEYESSYMYI